MDKLKPLVYVLVAILAISLGFNAYQSTQSSTLAKENSLQAMRLEMVSILSQAQVQVNAEIQKIGNSLQYACRQLSSTGLTSDEARSILDALVANSSFIVDASTVDLNGVFKTVSPSNYSYLKGTSITVPYSTFAASRDSAKPFLTGVVPLVEGFNGSSMMAPVFGPNGIMIGSVSIVFDPNELIGAIVSPMVADTAYTMWAMQTDSLEIYDADPAQVGLRIFSASVYEPYADVPVALYIAQEASGYSTYPFVDSLDSGREVTKECYWNTIGAYGTEWRLVIAHIIEG